MLALVTARAAESLDPDLPLLADAFRRADVPAGIVCWDDDTVDWARFDAALLRSTWDYTDRLDEFLDWVRRTSAATRLVNGPEVIAWNIDKHYLGELAAAGVPIVPTVYVEIGDDLPELDADEDVWVVKPTVGAGSNGARRCAPDEVADHVRLLHRSGRSAMVQPYLHRIDVEAETSLVHLADVGGGGLRFDHAFSKDAILRSTEVEQEGDLFAAEEIGGREAHAAQLALAERVLTSPTVASFGPLAYARVDLAPTDDGPVLMELELVEPSLYFSTSAGSADRAVAAWRHLVDGSAGR